LKHKVCTKCSRVTKAYSGTCEYCGEDLSNADDVIEEYQGSVHVITKSGATEYRRRIWDNWKSKIRWYVTAGWTPIIETYAPSAPWLINDVTHLEK